MTYLPRRPAPAPAVGARRWWRAATEIRTRRTRREAAYLAVTGVLGGVGLVLVAVLVVVGPVLALTVVGLPLVGLALVVTRWAGSLQREVVAWLFHREVPPPGRARPGPGLRAWTRAALTDRAGWRALAYLVLHLPVVVSAVVVGAVGVFAAGLVLGPVRDVIAPGGGADGLSPRDLLPCVVGLVVLCILPWVVRVVVKVDLRLVRTLLGATADDTGIERSRRYAFHLAAVTLRRLEGEGSVVGGGTGTEAAPFALDLRAGVRQGVVIESNGHTLSPADGNGSHHRRAEVAPFDRRDPDRGLGQALACLAAEVPTSTRLHLDLNGTRLPRTVEALAEAAATELMTNVVRHSGAGLAEVSAVAGHGSLTLRVSDDGQGGVAAGNGTGLDRLSEMIAPVKGHLVISSPPGGPTDITVALPLASRETVSAAAVGTILTDGPPPRIVQRTDGMSSR